ncbi:MAG: nuclear transport factor 2 family protein [Archangium sp.]
MTHVDGHAGHLHNSSCTTMVVHMHNRGFVIREYLRALEKFEHGDALKRFLADDFVFHELPNRLVPEGRVRPLDKTLEASAMAPKVLQEQRYEIRRELAAGELVALDVDWSATLKVPLGMTPAGGRISARICMWVKFRDGKICEQTNFDCYWPF